MYITFTWNKGIFQNSNNSPKLSKGEIFFFLSKYMYTILSQFQHADNLVSCETDFVLLSEKSHKHLALAVRVTVMKQRWGLTAKITFIIIQVRKL